MKNWVNLTKNGNPNGEGWPRWSPYSGNNHEVRKIDEEMGGYRSLKVTSDMII